MYCTEHDVDPDGEGDGGVNFAVDVDIDVDVDVHRESNSCSYCNKHNGSLLAIMVIAVVTAASGNPESTLNRFQTDQELIPSRLSIDPESTLNRFRINPVSTPQRFL